MHRSAPTEPSRRTLAPAWAALLLPLGACADAAPAAPDAVPDASPAEDATVAPDTRPDVDGPTDAGREDTADGAGADADASADDAADADAADAWSPAEIPGARVYLATRGVALDGPVAPVRLWDQVAATSPWHPRDGAGLVWFRDRLWLLGGWYTPAVALWNDAYTTNEVWVSDDLGAHWSAVLAHDPSPPETGPGARWHGRHTVGFTAYRFDGTDYLYVIGGDIYHPSGDVWRSTDGATWEEVAAHTPWEGRVLQMVAVYAGDLYVMGGQLDINDPTTTLRDVWRSKDGGATWTRLADAPWAPRGMVYDPFELDGKLWLCGGGTYDDAPRTFYNDVWSFDGATWREVSPDGAAPWLGREYHNAFAFDGELWISSGYGADGANHNDFWHSPDGVTWTEVPGSAPQPGHGDGVAVTPFGVIHASGNAMDTAVHRLAAHGEGALMSGWADLGSAGLDLAATAPERRPLFVSGAFGARPGVWLDGEDALLELATRDDHPDGRSVFWVGRTSRLTTWTDNVNPAMTVVGDSSGGCRDQAGYSGDQLELVVTDALGSWHAGHVLRGSGQVDGQTRLVGFTHASDGTVVAYIDGEQVGEPALTTYDAPYTGWDELGAGFAGGSRAQVMLGLVVVVPAVLSPEDLARLAAYARQFE